MKGIADGLRDLKSLVGENSVASKETEKYLCSIFYFMDNNW